jgi:uncharacterized repeat protein (TIGR01451 family)
MSVSSGSAGQRVVLRGGGFTAGESVQPYWNYGLSGALAQKSYFDYNPIVVAGAGGTATSDMFVPVVPSGLATVSLIGLTSGVVDTAAFTVVARLDTGATIAPAGSTLTFSGWGFGVTEEVTVLWPGAPSIKGSTDHKGAFTGKTFTIPAGTAAGSYAVTATGSTSHISASANVMVGPTPTGPAPGPDDWPNWGYDLQQHRVNTTETAFSSSNVSQLALAWQAVIAAPDKVQASPSIANGVVYIGSVHGLLSAYREATGTLLWSFQAPGTIYASPTIVNGIAYFGTVNEPQESQAGNYAFALNAKTGAVIWADALPNGGVWAVPLVANGKAIFTMANREAVSGGMIAFDALTGGRLWEDDTPEGIWGPPTLDPGGQYYYQGTGNPGTNGGAILKVSMATGSYTTLFTVPDVTGDDDVPSAPTYDNGNLYFGGKDGYVISISAATGAANWKYNTGFSGDVGIFGSTAVYDGFVIFESIGAKEVIALKESTGTLAWSYNTGGGPNSPVVADGIVFVAGYGGKLVALSALTGSPLWSSSLGTPSGGSAAVANGMVFQATYGHVLDAFALPGTPTPPTFTSDTPLTGLPVNTPYSYQFLASGSPAPTFAVASGALPTGMTLSSSGILTGTPSAVGTSTFTVTATNGSGTSVSPAITITVYAPTDMAVGLVGPTSAKSGATVVYTVTAYDLGPAAAGQVTATLTLPSGAIFVSALSGGTYTNGVVTWSVGAIASGRHVNLKVSISFSVTGTNTVIARAQAVNTDPNHANNSVSLNTPVS